MSPWPGPYRRRAIKEEKPVKEIGITFYVDDRWRYGKMICGKISDTVLQRETTREFHHAGAV